MEKLEQRNLFGEIEPPAIAIEESALRLGVSTATIRNWIKTKYLEPAGKGRVTLGSLEQFKAEVSGKEKLTRRANKSLRDSHDHDKIVSKFLDNIGSSASSSDKIGMEYESSLSNSYRNKEGIYYTPDDVVRNLFAPPENDVLNNSFCDPCCGSGNFIMRAIELGRAIFNNLISKKPSMELTELKDKIITSFTGSESDLEDVLAMVETDQSVFPFNEYEHLICGLM